MPRIAEDVDATALTLTPAEGYLLSRVDGRTSWSVLREIGGLPPAEVGRCLDRWLAEGLLELIEPEKPEEPSEASPGATPRLPVVKIDAKLDIPVEVQRDILDFAKRLDRPHHEILGVAADAGTPQIKKAYFTLSKKFHPDRYFRKNVGDFSAHIEVLFKHVLEAYELLSDPTTRAELQRSLAAQKPAPAKRDEAPAVKGRPPARRIAERMSLLGMHRRALEDRRRRAKQLFEGGMGAFSAQRWLEAARGVRLAIAFDPHNAAFRDAFGDVQRKAHEEQAKALIRKGDEAFDLRDYADAQRHYEDALQFRAFDADLSAKVAKLAWQVEGDLRKAKEFAAAACELEPDCAPYRLVLGRVYNAAGLRANARREFEAAVRLDPTSQEARQELRKV